MLIKGITSLHTRIIYPKTVKMSFSSALINLSIIVFISITIAVQPGYGAAVQTCSKSSTCTLMTKCSSAFSSGDRKKFPPICKWENSDPFVCCPTPEKIQTRDLVELPENECAEPRTFTPITPKNQMPFRFLIMGGTDVTSIDIYPFMAAIYQTAGKEKVFLCGGTLISKGVILTAAHCFLAKDNSSKYMVQLGSVRFGTEESLPDTKTYEVSAVKIHEQFNYPQLYNDIALIKFNGSDVFSDKARPICLLSAESDGKATPEVTVLGWGSKQIGGSQSSILQQIDLRAIPNNECNSTLAQMGALTVSLPKGIVEKIMCAGSSDNVRKDACQGDSGGPLVAIMDGKWRQRGIISAGIGCGIPGNPGIYTRVSEYITWIRTNS